MNYIKLSQTGGFPLDTDILGAMQSAYAVFNHLGSLAGDKAIISGCSAIGTSIGDGVVFINGEILPFKGGALGANIIIKEESETRVFEDGATKPVIFKRYATFGSSTPEKTYKWEEFKRIKNLSILEEEKAEKELLNNTIKRIDNLEIHKPIVGEIRQGIFDLNNLPEGWYYCNGENGTPDLRGYFLRGKTDERALGSFQEDAQQKITGEFPSVNPNGAGGNPDRCFRIASHYNSNLRGGGNWDTWGYRIGFDSSRQVRTADENRPKNYAVHFIMYLG